MSGKIAELKNENQTLKLGATETQTRITEYKAKWVAMGNEAQELFKQMQEVKMALQEERVDLGYFQENNALFCGFRELLGLEPEAARETVKKEPDELITPGVPFDSVGKEERIEEFFGRDGDYTALSTRRFVERFKVVKGLNMKARLRGWDSPSFRAGKLRLCLKGEAFDYVSFASSICEEWAENDETMIEKLREKFTNLQAIELNILQFEQSIQEPKESISDYLGRLRRAVKDAYDGDHQRELDRKVAWKFVSGLGDERIRRKLLEDGWMKTRQEAKPIEELLKVAEIFKKTDDAAKALGKSGVIGMTRMQEEGTVAAWGKDWSRNKQSSSDSRSCVNSGSRSSGSGYTSSSMPVTFIECWYCKKKHRGGWFHCSQREKEDPTLRPPRKGSKNSSAPSRTGESTDFRK